jgi:sirohydrochlorin ferrochelatase
MKKGSGDDPFADLDEEDAGGDDSAADPQGSDVEEAVPAGSDEEPDSSTEERYTDSGAGGPGEGRAETADPRRETADKAELTDSGRDDGQTKAEADGIPWVLRRSRVKEDRENVHQFFLREEYSTREDEIIEAVAGELDMRQKDLQKLDVREAMVASADPEAIAAVLREWGYEYLK